MADNAQTLQTGVTGSATGKPTQPPTQNRTFQATVVGTGAVAATVEVYGSNTPPVADVGTNGILLGTITLTGTTTATDGFATIAPWKWVWSKISSVSGTGATVSVLLGV